MRFSELLRQLSSADPCCARWLAADPELGGAGALHRAGQGQLSFLEPGNRMVRHLDRCQAAALLLPRNPALQQQVQRRNIAWAALADPRLGFAEALELLCPEPIAQPGIDPAAHIHPSARLGGGVSIAAGASIGAGCRLAEGVVLHPGVVLYDDVTVGADSVLHANAVIHRRSQLGRCCVIGSNTVLGSEGFGFIPTAGGWRKMPQTGCVVLEDGVEVGCNSAIDRPAVGETRIGAGTKIDNLVQIAHGVEVGRGCAFAAQVGVAGGAVIGNGVILAGQVGVNNRTRVGDGVIASSKTGIQTDVEPGQMVSGFPVMPHKAWLRSMAALTGLPRLNRAVRRLERRLEQDTVR